MLFPGSVRDRVPLVPQSLSFIELLILLERCVVPNTAIFLVLNFLFDTVQDIPRSRSVLFTVLPPIDGIAFSVFTAETPTLFFVFRGTDVVLPLLVERSGADKETWLIAAPFLQEHFLQEHVATTPDLCSAR